MTTTHKTRRTSVLSGVLALGLLAAACGSDAGDLADGPATDGSGATGAVETVTVDDIDIQLTSGLATFDTCSALLTHLQTEGAERVGAFGFNGGGFGFGGEFEEAMEDESAVAEDASDSAGLDTSTSAQRVGGEAGLVEGEDFSGTNNQERGVDEPDFVKTDGERIFTLTNGTFTCLLYTSPSPRDRTRSRMPSSA